jgi:hypothetical protein
MGNALFADIPMQPIEETKKDEEEEEEEEEKGKKPKKAHKIGVLSMTMNNAGNLLFAGCTDNIIRVFEVAEKKA